MFKLALCFLLVSLGLHSGTHIVSGCRIFSLEGEIIANFPGRSCHFLNDGQFISLNEKFLRFFNQKSSLLWENKIQTPNTRMTVSRSRIHLGLYYSKENRTEIQVLNLEGKVEAKAMVQGRVHSFNSLIKTQTLPKEAEYFYGDENGDLYFLNSELETILRGSSSEGFNNFSVGQTESGKFFYLSRSSQTEKFNPAPVVILSDENHFKFPKTQTAGFYFPRGGEVSYSGGTYAISHPMSGTYVVNGVTGELMKYLPITHFDENQIRIPDQLYIDNLEPFLSRWEF